MRDHRVRNGDASASAVRARTWVDAVGQPVAVGDTVWAVVGTSGAPSRVQRFTSTRVVVRRADGMVAVLRPSSVVVMRSTPLDTVKVP